MAYIIYTDGSCLKNPGGPGGYAAVLYHGEILHLELSGGEPCTTSNRMEIMAAITGLQAVQQPSIITLCSDSQYVIKTMTSGWYDNVISMTYVGRIGRFRVQSASQAQVDYR